MNSPDLPSKLSTDNSEVKNIISIVIAKLKAGEVQQAQAALQCGKAIDPKNCDLRFLQAILCLTQNNTQRAIVILQNLLNENFDNANVRHNLAHALLQQRNPRQAQTILLPLLTQQAQPTIKLALLMARVAYQLGNSDSAQHWCDVILNKKNNHPGALGLLALSYLDKQAYKKARKYAGLALKQDKKNHYALVALGYCALFNQKANMALKYFKEATSTHITSSRGWLGMGIAQVLQKHFKEAEVSLTFALKYLPDHIHAWHLLAWCQIALKSYVTAEHSLDQAYELNRSEGETQGSYGVLEAIKGNAKKSKQYIRKAQSLNKKSISAKLALQILNTARGDKEKAHSLVISKLNQQIKPGSDFYEALRKY